MKFFIVIFLLFSSYLLANTPKGTFVIEPIFNASVYMETAGEPSNPAIVLVHGLGDEASTIWANSIELLQKEYFVITFDLPGFGKSSKANELYSPQNYAKFIHSITQTYVKKPFHLVGHSMGGAIVLKYAQMYQKDVLSLVLVDAAGILHKYAYNKFLTHNGVNRFFEEQNGLIQGLQTPKLNNFIDRMAEKIDHKMTLDMDVVLASKELRSTILGGTPATIAAVGLIQTNFNGIPQTIDTRTTIIWGENDAIAPIQTGYVLDKLMPYSTLKIIPLSGHVPMLTHEEAFSYLLMEHLSNKKIAPKVEKNNPVEAYKLKIKNVQDATYSGHIKSLTIRDSHNVVIKDAIIEELFIFNSEIEIINSTFKGEKEVKVSAQNASVSIIASDIFGTIKLNNTRLNLSGVLMSSQNKPIVAMIKSTIIFSLCDINDKLIHGKEVLGN